VTGPGGRPPWWPEGEPWRRHGPPPWARRRGRAFIWRLAVVALAIWALAGAGTAALGWFLLNGFGPAAAIPRLRFASFAVLLVAALGLAATVRGFRRMAVPPGDLLAAAARIERGDYGARVAERGPRDVRLLARASHATLSLLHI